MSGYTVHIVPSAWAEARGLPGNMRQRVRRAIDELADQPRPPQSKQLDIADCSLEVRRLRLDRWRILYAVVEEDRIIDILAIRKRPPYDYGDLGQLVARLRR